MKSSIYSMESDEELEEMDRKTQEEYKLEEERYLKEAFEIHPSELIYGTDEYYKKLKEKRAEAYRTDRE